MAGAARMWAVISPRSSPRERRRPDALAERSAGGSGGARERAAAREHRATRRRRFAQARGSRRRGVRLGGAARRGARSRTTTLVRWKRCSSSSRPGDARGRCRPLGARRRRGERVVTGSSRREGAAEVVKVKSLATDEIRLNDASRRAGIRPIETDLAELIVQLAASVLAPARARRSTRTGPRSAICSASGSGCRPVGRPRRARRGGAPAPARRVPAARVAISGANFAVADTGTICVVESEGNGRMCTTLPECWSP